MSETFTFKLAETRKKDFFGNSRQDNLVGLEVSDGVSLEKGYKEEGFEEVVLVISDLGDELGEVPSPYLYQIDDLLSRNFEGTGFVKSIEELPSGKLSVTVEITFLPSQKPRLPEPFFTKIRGDEANNADGSSRQTIIQTELSLGVLLGYQREPSNTYDSNAIAILSPTGKQIGYLSSKLAAEFAPLLDAGGHLEINVKDLTGGDDPGKSTGVNIHVIPQATRPAHRPPQELSEEVRSPRPNPTPMVSSKPVIHSKEETESKPVSPEWKSVPTSSVPSAQNTKPTRKPLSKKTRTWLVVGAILLVIYICSTLSSCTPAIQQVEVTRIVESTKLIEVTRQVEVTRQLVVTATAIPPTPTPAFMIWKVEDAIEAFKSAGLEFENYRDMKPEDYGMAPLNTVEAIRFYIPTLCTDCGGRLYSFDSIEKLNKMAEYYKILGESSAIFFSHVFVKDNILIQINGEVPELSADKYQAALESLRK